MPPNNPKMTVLDIETEAQPVQPSRHSGVAIFRQFMALDIVDREVLATQNAAEIRAAMGIVRHVGTTGACRYCNQPPANGYARHCPQSGTTCEYMGMADPEPSLADLHIATIRAQAYARGARYREILEDEERKEARKTVWERLLDG